MRPSRERGRRSVRVATVVYGWLLRRYPAWFVDTYGAEMRSAFGSACERARREGRARFAWTVLAEWLDVVRASRRLKSGPQRRGRSMADGWLDVRVALRGLARRPAWAATAIVTLGLGIGGTASMFAAVRGLLLRPLPFDGEGVVVFWNDGDWSMPEFLAVRDWAEQSPFEAVAASAPVGWTLQGEGQTQLVSGVVATAGLFEVLGARAARGRTFERGDDAASAEPVVVLSHGLWQQEFGGDEAILGRRVLFDGQVRTVIGVMPEAFFHPTPAVRFWAPLPIRPEQQNYGFLTLLARTRAGVSMSASEAALAGLAERLGSQFTYSASWDKTRNPSLRTLREFALGDARRPMALLFAAVAVLMLIACANVSALVLGRAADRSNELAVRAALGAGRGRLVRQILTESMVLSLIGGVAGIVLGAASFEVLAAGLPVDAAWRAGLRLDGSLIAAGLVAALVAGSLVGILAVTGILRGRLRSGLVADRRGTGGRGRLQGALVVAEVTLALTLIMSATLLIRSIGRLQARDVGINVDDVLVVDLVAGSDLGRDARRRFFEQAVEVVAALPGVERAAIIQNLPVRDGGWQGPVEAEDRPELRGVQAPSSYGRFVSEGFFETLAVRRTAGRTFGAQDESGAAPVAVVNEAFVRMMWPDGRALGKQVRPGFVSSHEPFTVIGVVADVPIAGLRDGARPILYLPYAHLPSMMAANALVVRSTLPAASLVAAMRSEITSIDSRVAIARMTTMRDVVAGSIAAPRRVMRFLQLFGALALVLGAVGIYGVLANLVRGRMREFGVRLALGATPRAVVALVLRRALGLLGAGIVLGVLVALASARALGGLLYEIEPIDPLSLGSAVSILVGTGLLAAFLPARRAARTDPLHTLRMD